MMITAPLASQRSNSARGSSIDTSLKLLESTGISGLTLLSGNVFLWEAGPDELAVDPLLVKRSWTYNRERRIKPVILDGESS